MDAQRVATLRTHYEKCLLEDVLPFWLKHAPDGEYGGFFTFLDRGGSVFDTDKAMWLQSRAVWMFAHLYNTLEPRAEWLKAAQHGYTFLVRHGFDADGRMFFATTREGKPLRKRRYLFTETFGAIACAEYARAANDEQALERAKHTYRLVVDLYRDPKALPPKVIASTRRTKSHAMPMILLATTQILRQVDTDPLYAEVTEQALDELFNHFMKPDERALFETVGPNGERLDTVEGRTLNPGHTIETAWFVMRESQHRNDPSLLRKALDILDWSLERGWDAEYGGIFSFVDAEGKPPTQLEWDMKLWWPHTEALYALLLAHHLSGEARYLAWYDKVHEWAFGHFADPEYGEWYGYLHRDGSVSTPLKGGLWKGAFHVPRAFLNSLQLLRTM